MRLRSWVLLIGNGTTVVRILQIMLQLIRNVFEKELSK